MNKEFFRGMKEQIEPDEEQVEELKISSRILRR